MKEGSQFNSILDSKSVMWMRNSTKIEIMGENMEMLEMKNSTNKKKRPTVERITYRLAQTEERISEIEDKAKEILHSDRNKKKSKNDNIQELGT
jgi:tRNA(Ser,Leu) C12 N-acetylase TAN1